MPPDDQSNLDVFLDRPFNHIQQDRDFPCHLTAWRWAGLRQVLGDSYSLTQVPLGFNRYEPAGESALLPPVTVIVAIPVPSTAEIV